MSDFGAALEFTLPIEGGFSDDVRDSGGATNFGITLKTLSEWRGYPCTKEDVRDLKKPEAALIYYNRYWKPLGLGQVENASVATALFDAGVLFGTGTSALNAQRALLACDAPVDVDGHVGPDTLAALNTVEPRRFLAAFSGQLHARIDGTAKARPKDLAFKSGWEHRVDKYPTFA